MAEQLTGTIVAEKYRLDSLLRSGELGDFYRARHLFMDKAATLKVLPQSLALDDEIRERFFEEAKAAGSIEDPNILGVSDFGSDRDGICFIVYEGFDGEPLVYSVGAGVQFQIDQAASIARQVAMAMAAAHEKGFIHGNLTPDSVLVSNELGRANVRVFDFEEAEMVRSRRSDNRGAASVAYLAPECFSGLRAIDGRTDIYSLGIILYQMLAGEVPFRGETPTDVMLKHAEEEPPPLSDVRKDVSGRLEDVLRKALSKDPEGRHQSAQEFVEDLDHAVKEGARASKSFWRTAAVALVGIAVLAGVLIYATASKQTMPITRLQPDSTAQPVQPLSPATGSEEKLLVSMPGSLPGSMSENDIMAQPPSTLPGGDNYNPWATGAPPPGAPPMYIPPGGQYYQIDPSSGSPFMPNEDGVILVPVPANTNTQVRPSPTPRTPGANANTQQSTPGDASPRPAQPERSTPNSSGVERPAAASTPRPSGSRPDSETGPSDQ
ncbi:MAG TPA: protein kinase [Pyrinomonadaceae bacterium]|nr:protein kinase [Pyrinomonadaceae bacterium]